MSLKIDALHLSHFPSDSGSCTVGDLFLKRWPKEVEMLCSKCFDECGMYCHYCSDVISLFDGTEWDVFEHDHELHAICEMCNNPPVRSSDIR